MKTTLEMDLSILGSGPSVGFSLGDPSLDIFEFKIQIEIVYFIFMVS